MPENLPTDARFTPAITVFYYAVFAALWVFASGFVLTYTAEDPWHLDRAVLINGLVFVAVTSGFFYLLFSTRSSVPAAAGGPGSDNWEIDSIGLQKPLLVFLLLLLAVPVLGLAIVQVHGPELEGKAKESLQTIAEFKARQVERWLRERRQDGDTLAKEPGFIQQVAELRAGDAEVASILSSRMEAVRQAYGYESISVIDAGGGVLLQTHGAHPTSDALRALARKAIERDTPVTCLLCPGGDGEVQADFIVPLNTRPDQQGAAVALHMDPDSFLFPFIKQWPTHSPSGETLIVRRQGDRVVFLNDVRHRQNAPLALTFPVEHEDLPSAIAVRDEGSGIVQGVDYRGHNVFAAYQPVSGTDWRVIAKLDREEVQAPLHDLVGWVLVIALSAIAVVGFSTIILWRQQQRVHSLSLQAEKHRHDQVVAESEARLSSLVNTIPDIVWMKDPDGVFLACNRSFERLLGADKQEIIGGRDQDFFSREMIDRFRSYDDMAMRTGQPNISEERLTFAEDGYSGTFETIKTPVYGRDGEFIGVLGIARDITERKENESRIRRLSKLYATLSQVNQVIIHCRSQEDLFQRVCELAVESAGFKMACVLLPDAQGSKLIPAAAYGEGIDYLKEIWISPMDSEKEGRGPTGIALREGKPVWSQNFLNDPETRPWHVAATRFGFASAAALPIRRNETVIGTFTLYSGEVAAFDQAACGLLSEMTDEISYAIENLVRENRRREAEERLTLVLEGSNDAPWDWDLVSDQHYYSPQWWHMLGYEVDELPKDSDLWRRLIHPNDLGAVDEAIERILLPGDNREAVECRFRHKDGHYVPTLVRGIATRDASGKVVRLSGTIMDMTERKRIEQELTEQIQELQRWHEATLGRENRIIALKREVNELLAQAGRSARYLSTEVEEISLTQGNRNGGRN